MKSIRSLILGSTFFIARMDATVGDSQSLRTVKPPATIVGGDPNPAWVKVGITSKVDIDSKYGVEEEVWDPGSGVPELEEILRSQPDLIIKPSIERGGPLLAEMLFRGGQPDAVTGEFDIDSVLGFEAWCKWQAFDRSRTQRIWLDLWCDVKIAGATSFDMKTKVAYELECRKLRSDLNVGKVA